MACTNPKKAWASGLTKNNKQKIVFKKPDLYEGDHLLLPCGKCVSCKLSYAKQWATRVTHEIQTAQDSCFITLTYNDEHMPENQSVALREVQLFLKRVRRQSGKKFKFIACGEYGDKKGRPHYHLILMGLDFADKIWHGKTPSGFDTYKSATLEKNWTDPKTKKLKGFVDIGEATYQSAAYLARYCFKKQKDKKEYKLIDLTTGELLDKNQEFITMSGGIGSDWWDQFKQDTYKDYLNVNYMKNKVPTYYDKKLEQQEPERLAKIKEERMANAQQNVKTDNENVMENTIKLKQNSLLIRGLEQNEEELIRYSGQDSTGLHESTTCGKRRRSH